MIESSGMSCMVRLDWSADLAEGRWSPMAPKLWVVLPLDEDEDSYAYTIEFPVTEALTIGTNGI